MNVFPLPLRILVLLFVMVPLSARLEAKIGALGRIIPAGDILNLPGNGDAVAVVHVKEGDVVDAGAPLLTFRNQKAAEADVALAEMALREAETLGQLGIDALALKVEIAKRDFDYASLRLKRFSDLGGEAASPQQVEQRTYITKNAELAYLAQAKDLERNKLDRELRIERARTQLAMARDKLDRTTLCAPARMTVLQINAMVGTVPGGAAISLANLSEMHVVTEVFAGDLPKLKLGQEAVVTSTTLPAPVKGHVLNISRIITGRAKVANVLIRLDDPAAAAKLLNLEVNVSIDE
jgi:multidrug resistance efflux pump